MSTQDVTRKERSRRSGIGGYGVSLFRIFGIEIRLDPSVIIIFLLIVYSLGSGVFPQWHPDWSAGLIWGTAFVSGILFFISLLAHELSHSVVSQHYGIPVPRITLFLFGGMAETSREADRPKVEFMIAIAGPLMSLLIALACFGLVALMVDAEALEQSLAQEAAPLAILGPVATSLLWLGIISTVIAVFNMIPGFPMDGGRVFRAAIWAITGDLVKATRWAAWGGRLFGWFLIAMGVLSLFGAGNLGGIWWILIGWFISALASMSYRQLLIDNALRGHRVGDLMRTRIEEVDASMTLSEFVDRCLQRSSQQLWPVMEGGRMIGLISLSRVADLGEAGRHGKTVRDVMQEPDAAKAVSPETGVRDAFNQVAAAGDEPLPVISQGRVVGLIHQGDILKWLSLHD